MVGIRLGDVHYHQLAVGVYTSCISLAHGVPCNDGLPLGGVVDVEMTVGAVVGVESQPQQALLASRAYPVANV